MRSLLPRPENVCRFPTFAGSSVSTTSTPSLCFASLRPGFFESIADLIGRSGKLCDNSKQPPITLDEGAVLACMAYVDLNPIRAGLTERVEASEYTSVQQRLAKIAESASLLSSWIGLAEFGVGLWDLC